MTPFYQGRQAYLENADSSENPFIEGTDDWNEWNDGFEYEAAKADNEYFPGQP